MAFDGEQQNLDAVRQLRQAYWQNGYRPAPIWSPGAEYPDGRPVPSAGKHPVGLDWRAKALTDPPHAVTASVSSLQANTGIVCGDGIAGIDVDVLDQGLVDQIIALTERRLTPTPLVRIGRAPKTLLVYRADRDFAKLATPELYLPDGSKAQIEILAAGQQFVADGIHPDTMQPYLWTVATPAEVPASDLPIADAAALRDLLAEIEALLRAAGAAEKEPDEPDKPRPPPRQKLGPSPGQDGGFFRHVNSAALADLEAWVPELLPRARYQATGAWRVSSADLGRAYEEDLSLHPDGIHDFGPRQALTPIDVVIEFGDGADVVDAAKWLCARLGITPESLGWAPAGNKGAGKVKETGPKPDDPGTGTPHSKRRIVTGNDFAASFIAPDWLIDRILQRGRLYACTSLTGHGKTAVWLYIACMIQAGRTVGHLAAEQGNVLILAGENPEDLKARMLGMARTFNLKQLPYVLPATFPMTEVEAERLRQDIEALGVSLALIIPDTAASYFPGEDENDNVQAGNYARILRTLTTCPGNPAVVLPCHPIKNASRDNLLPRGGGAFLNELDGNLTLWSEEVGEMTVLYWQGKIRGPDFDPLHYKLKTVVTGRIDKKGRPIETILAQPIGDMEAANQTDQAIANEDAVLKILHANPKWSLSQIARAIGWVADPKAGETTGEPQRYKVTRTFQSLAKEGLVRKYRKKWTLTEPGKKALEALQDG